MRERKCKEKPRIRKGKLQSQRVFSQEYKKIFKISTLENLSIYFKNYRTKSSGSSQEIKNIYIFKLKSIILKSSEQKCS